MQLLFAQAIVFVWVFSHDSYLTIVDIYQQLKLPLLLFWSFLANFPYREVNALLMLNIYSVWMTLE